MCGTSAVGSTPVITAPGKTSVAGASGGGDVAAPATTGGIDLSALLTQVTAAVEALKQAITGMTNVAGASGGGGTDVAQGGKDAMAGCDMMGTTPPVPTQTPDQSEVDGAKGSGPGGKVEQDDSEVDGAKGSGPGGKVDQTDSEVDGAKGSGPGGKVDQTDSEVDGESGDGDVTQDGDVKQTDTKGGGADAVAAAQKKLDAAKLDATAKHDAVTAARTAVGAAQGGVTRAQDAVTAAHHRKVEADNKLVDAGKALEEARKSAGSYTVKDGDTLDSIAKHYGITKDELLKANPSVDQSSSGVKAGDVLKLPSGVGNGAAVKTARAALDAARVEVNRAVRAEAAAIAALEAAKVALEAAKAAVKAAKEAAVAADKALKDAQKALDAAKAAATTAGGKTEDPAQTTKKHRTYTSVKGDTVASIAKKYHITVKQLIELNRAALVGHHTGPIAAGTKLELPPKPKAAAA